MGEPPETPPPPEWAVQYARGAIRLGMRVPEIEQHLVSRGLAPEVANRLIMEIVEGAFQAAAPSAEPSVWAKVVRLFLCTALAGASLSLAYSFGGTNSMGFALVWVAPALVGIWFPELTDTGDSDWADRAWITGWFVLFLYLGYRIFLAAMVP